MKLSSSFPHSDRHIFRPNLTTRYLKSEPVINPISAIITQPGPSRVTIFRHGYSTFFIGTLRLALVIFRVVVVVPSSPIPVKSLYSWYTFLLNLAKFSRIATQYTKENTRIRVADILPFQLWPYLLGCLLAW